MNVLASGLSKHYRRGAVLSDATFARGEGTLTVLAGPNGAGKTTLLKRMTDMISGAGVTTFGGRRWAELSTPRREVGIYLGSGSFHGGATVDGHLRMVAAAARASIADADVVLEQFGLGAHRHARVSQLSLGLRQRLGLASAVLPDPPVLLLDEPFSALDPAEAAEVYSWLARQVAARRTVIVSTHHLDRIEPYATHLLFMSGGRMIADGSVEEVSHRHAVSASAAIACSNPAVLNQALAQFGVSSWVRGGEVLVLPADGVPVARQAALSAGVLVHAQWTESPAVTSLYEAIVP